MKKKFVCSYYILLFIFQFGIGQSSPHYFNQPDSNYQLAIEVLNTYCDGQYPNTTLLPGVHLSEVKTDLKQMIQNPNRTLLNYNGYYCGVVVVLNWLLNNRPEIYCEAVLKLVTEGEVSFNAGRDKIKLPRALTRNVNYQLTGSLHNYRTDLDSVNLSDFILGVSLVYSEKTIQRMGLVFPKATFTKYHIGNFIFANTMPWEIDDFFRKLGIHNFKHRIYAGMNKSEALIELFEQEIIQGNMPILFENHMITSTYFKNRFYKLFGAHFITLHDLYYDEDQNRITMWYWDYGKVKNDRIVDPRNSPRRAKNLKQAMRRAKRTRNTSESPVLEATYISVERFLTGLKGYWIPY